MRRGQERKSTSFSFLECIWLWPGVDSESVKDINVISKHHTQLVIICAHGMGRQESRETNGFGSGNFTVVTGIVTLKQNGVVLLNDVAPG